MQLEDVFSNLPALETERLILRKLTMDDAADIHNYASNPDVSKNVFWEAHRTLSGTKDYIRFILDLYENGNLSPWGIEY